MISPDRRTPTSGRHLRAGGIGVVANTRKGRPASQCVAAGLVDQDGFPRFRAMGQVSSGMNL